MNRLLVSALTVPLVAAGVLWVAAVAPAADDTASTAGRSAASTAGRSAAAATSRGAVLDQDIVVSRCLPQLGRRGDADGSVWTVKPLSTSTVVPAKPFVGHHVGDLVAFQGQIRGVASNRVLWARLHTWCRVPSRDTGARPGSERLPASATRPSRDRPTRNLEVCTEARDGSGGDDVSMTDDTQVVAPDVRGFRSLDQDWGTDHIGVQVLSDPDNYRAVLCSYGIFGDTFVSVIAPARAVRDHSYLNGYDGQPDRYYAAGVVPSAGVQQTQPVKTIEVAPPGRRAQRFPVLRKGLAGDGGVGVYAIAMSFRPVTQPLGQQTTKVRMLGADDRVLWSGRWDVGIEGH